MNVSSNIYVTMSTVLLLSVKTVMMMHVVDNDNVIPEIIQEDDVVCSGWRSSMGLSFSGSPSFWYNGIRDHYTGCTYVDDNLLLTWFIDTNINYDFSFLRSIRYVRGYVLIAVSSPETVVPLDNLQIIRANNTFNFYDGREYGLAILSTNFTSIRLPNLVEISRGDVVVQRNSPNLRIELSRSWDQITRGRATWRQDAVRLQPGLGTSVADKPDECSARCPRRCYRTGEFGCCDSQCAGGCSGPRNTQCELCKDYSMFGECISHCMDQHVPFYRRGTRCLRY